ncbi:hypothetical protein C2E23DRAFT_479464 [Lenzites betulinus]|nr:hypothetical protein C2E23DRAFT_479464 [Lenzites betulinus]
MYRRDDGLDVHFSTARNRASKSYTKPIMSSSSTPSESNQCSPMSCAGAANVSLSCLADPQCLCADSTAALAVWNCLFNVCTLTDVTLARTTLLLQCQAIGEGMCHNNRRMLTHAP